MKNVSLGETAWKSISCLLLLSQQLITCTVKSPPNYLSTQLMKSLIEEKAGANTHSVRLHSWGSSKGLTALTGIPAHSPGPEHTAGATKGTTKTWVIKLELSPWSCRNKIQVLLSTLVLEIGDWESLQLKHLKSVEELNPELLEWYVSGI